MMALLRAAIFLLHVSICYAADLHYKRKFVSKTEDDLFGWSMDAKNGMLVIGAPLDNEDEGSVTVVEREVATKLQPRQGEFFGREVMVNQRHIVAGGGRYSTSLYIYSAQQPYTLKARIPTYGDVFDIGLGDDDTVAVAIDGSRGPSKVSVYAYDGHDAWHQEATWKFGKKKRPSVALYSDVVAVGVGEDELGGSVYIYSRVVGQWQQTQVIKPSHPHLTRFGDIVAMHAGRLVLSSGDNTNREYLWVYALDASTNKWIPDGSIVPRYGKGNDVDIQNDIIAVSVLDETASGAVSTVYKRVNNDELGDKKWVEYAHLTAERLRHDQNHNKVRVDGHLVFTSRVSYGDDLGTVYVHDLSEV